MRARRIATIVTAGALVIGGAGAAIAATSSDDGKESEQAILADAAKRLDKSPDELRDALAAAEDAQIDKAVEEGELTRKQADAMKRFRRESGRVLGIPHPHGPGPHMDIRPGGPGPRGGLMADVAKALGMETETLFEQLRGGKTIAEIAKARGKSLDEVEASLRKTAKERLDQAVEDEDLTRKQADAMLEHLEGHFDRLGKGRGFGPRFGPPHRFRGRRGPGGPPGLAMPVPPPRDLPG